MQRVRFNLPTSKSSEGLDVLSKALPGLDRHASAYDSPLQVTAIEGLEGHGLSIQGLLTCTGQASTDFLSFLS